VIGPERVLFRICHLSNEESQIDQEDSEEVGTLTICPMLEARELQVDEVLIKAIAKYVTSVIGKEKVLCRL
jgi:hypothetical protein